MCIYFKINFVCCHINHGTREGESDYDEQFCYNLCRNFGIKIFTKRLSLDRWGCASENFARKCRKRFIFRARGCLGKFNKSSLYKHTEVQQKEREGLVLKINSIKKESDQSFLSCIRRVESNFEYLQNFNYKVLTAHTQDDFVETVFLKLLRGSGASFIFGIKKNTRGYFRPALDIQKSFLIEFLSRLDFKISARKTLLLFCNDYTNNELIYTRNFLRNKVFPDFSKINPQFKSIVFNNMTLLHKTALSYQKNAIVAYQKCRFFVLDKKYFSRIIFLSLNKTDQLNFLRYLVSRNKYNLRDSTRLSGIKELRKFLIYSEKEEYKLSNLLFKKTAIKFCLESA
jgi:tRNA(Ile)-lysidine synthase TilS/MesJ